MNARCIIIGRAGASPPSRRSYKQHAVKLIASVRKRVTPKFICNDVIARLAKWRVLATTGVCASARIELKRQRFVVIGVTDLCGKMVLEFGKLCR